MIFNNKKIVLSLACWLFCFGLAEARSQGDRFASSFEVAYLPATLPS
ncbi:MAG TPA: hypothetical protein QF901_11800 [Gammaproteobacteria bacterium]|nr:hypothetical protein [Gammaproteobacteria bacterium]